MKDEVCIIGLGYVGLTLAVAMAEAGYRVRGVERDRAIRETVSNGKAHFSEVGLDEVLSRQVNAGILTCTEALIASTTPTAYVITVGTPLDADGVVNLSSLNSVLVDLVRVLKDGDAVILRSTVKVGTTRDLVKPYLDRSGASYHLAFCPERTLEGKALSELASLPQIIGGIDEASTTRAEAIFGAFSPRLIRVANAEAAEMVKLISNTQRDLMFAFANEVAEMCDVVGVSATQVIEAACKDYPRSSIARPGLVGGPCLEKDAHILAQSLLDSNYRPHISMAGRALNERLPIATLGRLAKRVRELGIGDVSGQFKISILGLAFKGEPQTDDLRGTMAVPIINAIRELWPRANICAYDPVVHEGQFKRLAVAHCESLEDAYAGANITIIQNSHHVFRSMDIRKLSTLMRRPGLIYDYWNLFDATSVEGIDGILYAALGNLAYANETQSLRTLVA